jgi:redox-sensitive bicupin YhaK (pirin superfamily)
MEKLKAVRRIYRSAATHWVGDGFQVRNLFPSNDLGQDISPFLLLDYAAPKYFPPSGGNPRGVGKHPHRGFETVTIVYQGELEHRDSGGNHGSLGPGDVQWMTAGSGVVHEEKHAAEFAKRGGTVEMVQLWVNLPKALKMSPLRYQTLTKEQIPAATLPGGGEVRVIAGDFQGSKGPAQTFTPINLYDVHLQAGQHAEFVLPTGYNTALFLLRGSIVLNGTQPLSEAELALFAADGEQLAIAAETDATLLLLNGEPIQEPIARRGPFVMNTEEELIQAARDYQAGKMGHL